MNPKRVLIAAVAALLALAASAEMPAPKIGPDPNAVQVTVNLTGSPLTGTCGYTMNLSWSAANASVCTKTGAWTGSASASGSEQQTVNGSSQTYTLTCSSNTDSRTLTWTNPTTNVDGTAASLSGNKVYHANSAANIEVGPPIILTPAKTTYLLTGLPAGPRVVGVKATGSVVTPGTVGLDSAMSGLATVSIVLPTGVGTVNATCTPPPEPKPPTGVTIGSTVWEIIQTGAGPKVGRDVGLIDIGVVCLGEEAYITQGVPPDLTEYWMVPRDLTRIYRRPKSYALIGQCQRQATT